jgi:hypothetical protein
MARWITVKKAPFDYRFPYRTAITAFTDPGEYFVKDEVAEFAVRNGYAREGKADAFARSHKGRGARRSRRKETAAAKAADDQPGTGVGDAYPADPDRTADRPAVDRDAGER